MHMKIQETIIKDSLERCPLISAPSLYDLVVNSIKPSTKFLLLEKNIQYLE